MAKVRYVDRVSMTGFDGWPGGYGEPDIVYFGAFELRIGRSLVGYASYLNLHAPDGSLMAKGYRTGMGKFTIQDWRSGYKYHHSFELWASIFTYLLGVIDVWESRYGQHAISPR